MSNRSLPAVLIMVCFYMFLFIERPWESIRYLNGIPIERTFAVIMIFWAFTVGRIKIVSSSINKWVYGLLALHFILAPFAQNSSSAVDQGIEYAKVVVIYLLMLSVVDDEASLKVIIKVYIFSMMIYVLHSLWEYHNGSYVWDMGIYRMVGVGRSYNQPNAFGASLVLSIPFVYTLFRLETKSILRILYTVYFGSVVLCLVLTGSRSSSIAFVFLLLLWVMLQHGKRKIVIFVVTLIAFSTIWISMPAEKQVRIKSIWDKDAGPANAQKSTDGRKLGFIAGWEMFRHAPFTGIGAGGDNFVEYRMEHLDGIPEQSHNLYAEVLSAFGVVGAFFFIGLVTSTWRGCLKVRRFYLQSEMEKSFCFNISGSIIICLILLLLLGLSGHNFYRPLWLWMSAWVGSMMQIINQKQDALYKLQNF